MRSAIYNFEEKRTFHLRQSHEDCVQPLSTTVQIHEPEQPRSASAAPSTTLVADVLNPKVKLTVACNSTSLSQAVSSNPSVELGMHSHRFLPPYNCARVQRQPIKNSPSGLFWSESNFVLAVASLTYLKVANVLTLQLTVRECYLSCFRRSHTACSRRTLGCRAPSRRIDQ